MAPEPTTKRRRTRRSTSSRVKLEDVARTAEVSSATVSRVLNAPDTVSETTKDRVHAAIKDLGWIPHGAAKALATLRTRTVGALIPTLGHQAIAAMLETLQRTLGEQGYTLLLGRPDEYADRTLAQAEKMIQQGVECMILMGEDHPDALFELLDKRGIFTVITYTSGHYGRPNCIGFDNFGEMAKLTHHLLDLGHRDFAIITRPFVGNDRIRQRIEGINAVLADAGLAVRPKHFIPVRDWTIGSGRMGMRQLLAEPTHPTAVMCANDYLAAGALIEARTSGYKVPEDFSITGFDNVDLAEHMDPPLTTIQVPAREIGQAVGEFVVRYLELGELSVPHRLEAALIIRGSTAVPRGTSKAK
ncbi:LacI family DNA-binding transcriptional regulator [Aureimonas fodinaquatilis]|uniref:LacI family DNA-binding transcriptional regulator n=1 Tax=Aureimonas fodinaquatilis TaxID=2565783 RepID=A0A5B0DUZ2_9HYPH|nr:LacI family DNA-binding transcriptional regulator [Aureimonas fodinaquatilis]KAA0970158.1 LacI family DNA-binding transcriptional regulator [Aureimonas fodinaquatilis]